MALSELDKIRRIMSPHVFKIINQCGFICINGWDILTDYPPHMILAKTVYIIGKKTHNLWRIEVDR